MKYLRFYFIALIGALLLSSAAWATSSIIVDNETGCILEDHGRNDRVPMASLAQVAVAITLLDWSKVSHLRLDNKVEVPPNVLPQGPTNPMGLQPGDRISLRDLLYLTLLASDSEASETIATAIGQQLPNPKNLSPSDNFVSQMNALATELQMKHTLFLNPTGLDLPTSQTQPTSSPADLARLTRYAYSKAGIPFYVAQRSRGIHVERQKKTFSVKIYNTNKLLDTDHIDGVKAAYSPLASGCIILTSEHEPQVKHVENTVYTAPRRIIVVLLGSPTPFKEGLSLTRHGWSLYDKWAQAGRSLHFRRFL